MAWEMVSKVVGVAGDGCVGLRLNQKDCRIGAASARCSELPGPVIVDVRGEEGGVQGTRMSRARTV